jgi:3-oxoacyl-[acyl-carrier protein] reductase
LPKFKSNLLSIGVGPVGEHFDAGVNDIEASQDVFDAPTRTPPTARRSYGLARGAGTPEEVADLIAFLASERAAYISGQVISINGAMV